MDRYFIDDSGACLDFWRLVTMRENIDSVFVWDVSLRRNCDTVVGA